MSTGRVAIVTAASSGIGAACAREFAARGYHLALMSRSGAVQDLARELHGIGIEGSVTDPQHVERLVSTALEAFGRIDGAVVSTGHALATTSPSRTAVPVGADSRLLDIPDDDWRAAFELYFLHAVSVTRAVVPAMQKGGGGSIVIVSSFSARNPDYSDPTSSTIRRALSGFTKLCSDRLGASRIRVNNLLPGFLENWEWSDELMAAIPLGRPGALREIAGTAAFLLSDDAGYITGQDVVVDGGASRGV